ncbi:hypothetical protein Bca4012_060311 [Brassica carinata]|uniref:Uncharacterized protein n=1 Tax=Brassica carinata TaxID=52824 RepID=A0A8X7S984_BRACI|nr:hypothetical protein Bca52824_030627 [Brassica carinata]
MSSEKKEERREEDNGDVYRGKPSTEVVRTVTEEEVDEFFKILRRLHVATRTVARVNGGVVERELPSKKRKRSQSLGLRNSLDTKGVQEGGLDGLKRVGLRNSGLDLNCIPEPEAVKMRLFRLGLQWFVGLAEVVEIKLGGFVVCCGVVETCSFSGEISSCPSLVLLGATTVSSQDGWSLCFSCPPLLTPEDGFSCLNLRFFVLKIDNRQRVLCHCSFFVPFGQGAYASSDVGYLILSEVSLAGCAGFETLLGDVWRLRSSPTLASKASVKRVPTALRYGCSCPVSPLMSCA